MPEYLSEKFRRIVCISYSNINNCWHMPFLRAINGIPGDGSPDPSVYSSVTDKRPKCDFWTITIWGRIREA
jgi:hypothetical protein